MVTICTTSWNVQVHYTSVVTIPRIKNRQLAVEEGLEGWDIEAPTLFLKILLLISVRLSHVGRSLPWKIPDTHLCSRLSRPLGPVRPEGLRKLKEIQWHRGLTRTALWTRCRWVSGGDVPLILGRATWQRGCLYSLWPRFCDASAINPPTQQLADTQAATHEAPL
jgi:hypothetical protein